MKFKAGDLIQTKVDGVIDCEAIVLRHWKTKSEYQSCGFFDSVLLHITFDRSFPEYNGKSDTYPTFRDSRWELKKNYIQRGPP
tara:strand:+ start:1972 stop:2220 length:249 start_codon:yes stop_codon:yes gene_type:complete